jgi:hypothetical protein
MNISSSPLSHATKQLIQKVFTQITFVDYLLAQRIYFLWGLLNAWREKEMKKRGKSFQCALSLKRVLVIEFNL